ncbi:hypothetical protein ALI22I_18030 [Saccharothrix sp. ALI-22-I]|uniref:NACHT domain-containing protein n=1 Tax=Saccharothrix sp. ALI-22-I TaxID=1933778 RepID=UPI00097BE3BC|nr:NACHT domain-containing protein [Saccharothrix sp. ALI-22-I]ONI88861.1 hypothetical protein ALI22I_18030 [Saccharothrix sp. ALI-22-I]
MDVARTESHDGTGQFGAAAGHAKPEPVERVPSPVDDRLVEAAGRLAYSVRTRWQREEEHRQVHDPLPLPVRWRPVAAELTDSWANIRRVRAGDTAAPLDLTGQLDRIVDVYRRIPSGRLVVLGRAGSGKTILALRFVLDMLKNRAATEPVPVIFGLGSWNPTTTDLRDWITEQVVRDHPDLAVPGPGSSTLAAALVESGHVLPVLDGFDEIAAGLHLAALDALNGTGLPLLLTSRPDEYAAAVAGIDVLTAAAGVELTDLTTADLAGYLPRTTRKTGRTGPAWQPVLAGPGVRVRTRARARRAAHRVARGLRLADAARWFRVRALVLLGSAVRPLDRADRRYRGRTRVRAEPDGVGALGGVRARVAAAHRTAAVGADRLPGRRLPAWRAAPGGGCLPVPARPAGRPPEPVQHRSVIHFPW